MEILAIQFLKLYPFQSICALNHAMIILGIETSCDETAVAIIDGSAQKEQRILSSLVLSQLEEHRAFGGVVPEVAARAHIDHIHTLIEGALQDADLTFDNIEGIAATSGPGLIGGVMIGMIAGKAIAAPLSRSTTSKDTPSHRA
jgi:N6-L-threonylcarbamoyladenine synthase